MSVETETLKASLDEAIRERNQALRFEVSEELIERAAIDAGPSGMSVAHRKTLIVNSLVALRRAALSKQREEQIQAVLMGRGVQRAEKHELGWYTSFYIKEGDVDVRVSIWVKDKV